MGTTEERKMEKIPWIPLVLLTAVLSFLAMASFRLMTPQGSWWMCKFNFGIISRVTCIAVLPFLLPMMAYPFRKRISPSTLTFLYTAGVMVSFTLGFGYEDWVLQFARPRIYDDIGLLNVWWEPPLSSIEAMLGGGIATDWIAWGPIVSILSLLYLGFFFFTSTAVLIFRRSWLDIEKIPFPLALTNYEAMKLVQGGDEREKGGYAGKRLFAVGILLGFVYVVPVFMAKTFPWFPDIFSSNLICPTGAWHLPENHPLGSVIVGLASVSVDPMAVAIFILAPLSVSFNVWFWTLVMLILEQIAFYMGYYTGAPGMSGGAKLCCTAGLGTGPPFYWPIPSMLGGFLALTVMYIFLHRGYVLETIRIAIGSVPKPEYEKGEAMSYRSMYVILILSAIAGISSLMLLGVNVMAATIILLTSGFVTWFAMTLVLGMAGFGASDTRMWAVGYMRLVWPDPSAATLNLDYVMSHLWAAQGANVVTYGFGNGFYSMALSMKMASLTGTSNRNTYLVGAVCMLISVPIVLASSVWFVNTYGTKVLSYFTCSIQDQCEANPAAQASRPPASIYASYGAAGFILTALLSFLHARFVWFPFEPIGFIIALSFSGQWSGAWSAFLVAWIVKSILLRAGGSALYEKYALPIVGGFITGTVLASTVAIVMGMVRFYIPF